MDDYRDTLIRIHTDDDEAVFDVDFQDDIVLSPYSQIALQSLTMERQDKEIIIDGANDGLIVQVSSQIGNRFTLRIPHGILSKNTQEAYFRSVTDLINNQLRIQSVDLVNSKAGVNKPTQTGMEALAFVGASSHKVNFKLQHKPKLDLKTTTDPSLIYIRPQSATDPTPGDPTISLTNNQVKRNYASNSGSMNDAYIGFTVPVCSSGCGYAGARVGDFGGAHGVNGGFIMGLTQSISKIKNNSIQIVDLDFGIRVKENTSIIEVLQKVGGVGTFANNAGGHTLAKFTTADGNNADFLSFNIESDDLGQKKCQIIQYKEGGVGNNTRIVLADFPIEIRDSLTFIKKEYYFIIAPFNNDNIKIQQVQLTVDPYFNVDNNKILLSSENNEIQAIPSKRFGVSIFDIELSASVADYMGYNLSRFNPQGETTNQGDYLADRIFENNVTADCFVVELLNIPLDTYDSFKKGRANVLAYVPYSEVHIDSNSGLVQYEPSERYYLDLNNASNILLRNIKARIVAIDFSKIDLQGIATISMILRRQGRPLIKPM